MTRHNLLYKIYTRIHIIQSLFWCFWKILDIGFVILRLIEITIVARRLRVKQVQISLHLIFFAALKRERLAKRLHNLAIPHSPRPRSRLVARHLWPVFTSPNRLRKPGDIYIYIHGNGSIVSKGINTVRRSFHQKDPPIQQLPIIQHPHFLHPHLPPVL